MKTLSERDKRALLLLAIAGVFLYLVLQRLGMARAWASVIAMASIVALRLASIAFDWQLPVFSLPKT